MNLSIIDIGTQSFKHYIFEVEGNTKKSLHYKRYSDANLGADPVLSDETIKRTLAIIKECVETNKASGVEKLQLLGTEILRTAPNASAFTAPVKELTGEEVQIISQDQEALYLYEGFVNLLPSGLTFAAMNIGGGSTEVVIGDKDHLIGSQKIPFGVKSMKKLFSIDDKMDWKAIDTHLEKEIVLQHKAKTAFVTGVLRFLSTVGPHLGFQFEECDIPNHPIKISMDSYVSFLETMRATPMEELKKYYPEDPTYADNFVTGQSVYVGICKKLGVTTVIPSNNDLTDGVVHHLTQ